MDKRLALIQLIKHSQLISDEGKVILLKNVSTMPDGDVESIGKLLAWDIKATAEDPDNLIDIAGKIGDALDNSSQPS